MGFLCIWLPYGEICLYRQRISPIVWYLQTTQLFNQISDILAGLTYGKQPLCTAINDTSPIHFEIILFSRIYTDIFPLNLMLVNLIRVIVIGYCSHLITQFKKSLFNNVKICHQTGAEVSTETCLFKPNIPKLK